MLKQIAPCADDVISDVTYSTMTRILQLCAIVIYKCSISCNIVATPVMISRKNFMQNHELGNFTLTSSSGKKLFVIFWFMLPLKIRRSHEFISKYKYCGELPNEFVSPSEGPALLNHSFSSPWYLHSLEYSSCAAYACKTSFGSA
jgi:hypothetical protein